MRHNVFGRKLKRDVKERKALFKNLIRALIAHGRIKTTIAKAKAVGNIADKLVRQAKEGTTATKNQVASFLTHKESIDKLTKDIVPQFEGKLSGFVKIYRVGRRAGDNAEEAILEWAMDKKESSKSEVRSTKKKKKTEKKEKKA